MSAILSSFILDEEDDSGDEYDSDIEKFDSSEKDENKQETLRSDEQTSREDDQPAKTQTQKDDEQTSKEDEPRLNRSFTRNIAARRSQGRNTPIRNDSFKSYHKNNNAFKASKDLTSSGSSIGQRENLSNEEEKSAEGRHRKKHKSEPIPFLLSDKQGNVSLMLYTLSLDHIPIVVSVPKSPNIDEISLAIKELQSVNIGNDAQSTTKLHSILPSASIVSLLDENLQKAISFSDPQQEDETIKSISQQPTELEIPTNLADLVKQENEIIGWVKHCLIIANRNIKHLQKLVPELVKRACIIKEFQSDEFKSEREEIYVQVRKILRETSEIVNVFDCGHDDNWLYEEDSEDAGSDDFEFYEDFQE